MDSAVASADRGEWQRDGTIGNRFVEEMAVPCVVVAGFDTVDIILVGTDGEVETCHGVASLMVADGKDVEGTIGGVDIGGVVPCVGSLAAEMVVDGVGSLADD